MRNGEELPKEPPERDYRIYAKPLCFLYNLGSVQVIGNLAKFGESYVNSTHGIFRRHTSTQGGSKLTQHILQNAVSQQGFAA